ncbi:MAG TPA: hypothetical protein VF083_13025 [Acidimicrobiia bacterium]
MSRPRSVVTHSMSRARISSLIPGVRNRVKITSLPEPLATTRIGTYTSIPLGMVRRWSSTPYSLRGVNRTSIGPSGLCATQWPPSGSRAVARPVAQRGKFSGRLVNSYTSSRPRSIEMLMLWA